MRILPSDEHQARKEKMLQAVVHLYIRSGKPVGSSTIGESYKMNLSPATIRNVLADLEKEGFLSHPHTSAGRIPTDKGYRFYVDSIVHVQRLAVEEELRIREGYNRRRQEIEEFMLSTTRVLSTLSHCTGFVLPHRSDVEKLRRIELIEVKEGQILGVLVSESGFVKNQMIKVDRMPNEETLRLASRFLNEQLTGLSFPEAQGRLMGALDQFNRHMREQNDLFEALSHELFGTDFRKDFYVEGASNIWNSPDLRDYETLRSFSQFVDEKEALEKVLTRGLTTDGLQVRIGAECFPELKEFSVVSSGFQFRGRPMGVLGILGPKRMEYERMMSIVDTMAKLVNQYMKNQDSLVGEIKKDDI